MVVFGKVKKYDFSFDGNTGNLLSRSNSYRSLSESFGYDTGNLDRLTSVTGPSAQSVSYDPNNKGNISTKSDAGTFTYDPSKKYALKIVSGGLNISNSNQQVIYNAFEKVQSITEGVKSAEFTYNADNQRIRMVVKNNGAVTKTRWYFGGSCEREQVGSTVNHYIWIGGDAYSAVAVAKKVNTGSFTVYNIFRDHLGTITHLRNSSTGQVDEFSFDAWGRRRDKDNWGYTVSGDPVLFADRGFTAHEFLPDFNLYNMNGRLYDPVVGRFLSPDPYISDPSFSQSYNRYSYCLNNPLKYSDPSGEIAILLQMLIAGGANHLIVGLNNWINGMKFNDAFKASPKVFGVNYSPTANTWSQPQFVAQRDALVQYKVEQQINAKINSFSGMDRELPTEWNIPLPQIVGSSPLNGGYIPENGQSVGRYSNDQLLYTIGMGLNAVGFVASGGEYSNVVHGSWRGANGVWYSTNWGGNQWTGARANAMSRAGAFKLASRGTFMVGTVISGYQGYRAIQKGDYSGAAKSGLDIGMGYIATFGGPPGWIIGGGYFALDALGVYGPYPYVPVPYSPFYYQRPDNTYVVPPIIRRP